jgi:uncharacterized Zn-binding protein involved in type VI secretion
MTQEDESPTGNAEGSGEGKGEGKNEEESKPVVEGGYKQDTKYVSHEAGTGRQWSKGGSQATQGELTEGPKPPGQEADEGKSQVSKKAVIKHVWGERQGNLGPAVGAEAKGKYASGSAAVGIGYYKAEAASQLSYDLAKKEAELEVIKAEVKGSVVHGEAKGSFDVGSWLSGLFADSSPSALPGIAPSAGGGPMAARVTDPTAHGSPLAPGIGSPNVLIGGMPAWRTLADFHACPIVKGVVPDVGGVVTVGSPTVLINFMMACRVGDMVNEAPGGPNPIVMGCPTVMIGVPGSGTPGEAEPTSESKPGVALAGKAEGDLLTAKAEAEASLVVNKEKALAVAKAGAMAAVASGSISGGLTIPLWGSHSITLGGTAEGSVLSAGAEAGGSAGWTNEQGFVLRAGAKAALGLGVGVGFSIGIK